MADLIGIHLTVNRETEPEYAAYIDKQRKKTIGSSEMVKNLIGRAIEAEKSELDGENKQ